MTLAARAAIVSTLALIAAPARAAPAPSSALAAVRQQCIAAAQQEQRQETAAAALRHQFDLLSADAAGRRRDLDGSRPEQAHLLAALLFLSRTLDNPLAAAGAPPLDRRRGELLIKATAPELRAEAHALMREISETRRLRGELAARRDAIAAADAALARSRAQLAQFVVQRSAVLRPLMPESAAAASGLARLAGAANDTDELIKSVDAAAERRDRSDAARGARDEARPAVLRAFDPPQSALLLPVSGTISRRFGEPDAAGTPSQGLDIAAMPGAEVIAPFDGQVVYAGAFRDFGLLLIIRHGDLYHSLLAGLGRVDVIAGQWVLAGEPVGAMPQAAQGTTIGSSGDEPERGAGGLLHFELRRGGQPVDFQPWLATGEAGRAATGEQRMRE